MFVSPAEVKKWSRSPYGPHMNTWPDAGMTRSATRRTPTGRGPSVCPRWCAGPARSRRARLQRDHQPPRLAAHLLAMAGEPDIEEKLEQGPPGGEQDLQGPPRRLQLAALPDRQGRAESARRSFFYFNDDGDLVGLRYDNWKVVFMEQRIQGRSGSGRSRSSRCASQDLQPAHRSLRARRHHVEHVLRLDPRAPVSARPGAGDRRAVPGHVQGIPAAPEGGELHHRSGDGEDDGGLPGGGGAQIRVGEGPVALATSGRPSQDASPAGHGSAPPGWPTGGPGRGATPRSGGATPRETRMARPVSRTGRLTTARRRPTGTRPTAAEMVWIPGGTFRMGSDKHYPEERPVHRGHGRRLLDGRAPGHQRAVRRFVEATGHVTFAELPPNPADYPGALPEMLHAGSLVVREAARAGGPARLQQLVAVRAGRRLAASRRARGSSLEGRERHPVVHVTYGDAEAYRALGGQGRSRPRRSGSSPRAAGWTAPSYAWGDEFTPDGRHMANTWQGEFPWQNLVEDGYEGTSPVGCVPARTATACTT